MDIDTMEPGVDFVEYIDRALASAGVLIALIGPDWLTITDQRDRRRLDDPEDFVRVEVAAALDRADVRVIPVLVGGAMMPGADDLPEPLARLRRRNALEVSDTRWNYDVGLLVAAVERSLGGSDTTPTFSLEQTTSYERTADAMWAADLAPPPLVRDPAHLRMSDDSVVPSHSGDHRRSRLWLALAAGLLLALAMGGGVLAVTLGGSEETSGGASEHDGAPNYEGTGEAPQTEQDPVSVAPPSGSGDISYELYSPSSGGYEAMVPSGRDWVTTPESEPSPGIRRTTIEGPRGVEVWIDYTPAERAEFSPADKQVESHREVSHPRLGSADVWTFTRGVSLCQRSACVDYLINDGQQGFGVLAGGPDSATARDVARRVAMSVSPTAG
jgi:hypothetical protein